MERKHIGDIIAYERKKKKVSLEKLSSGIISPMGLKRLEYGERIPSFFILERLMERLGKSMNKLEFLLHEKDYQIYYLRGRIERLVEKDHLEEASQAISYYESLPLAKEALHHQYICKMKAVIFKQKGEGRLALDYFEKALSSTLCWWKNTYMKKNEISLEEIIEDYSIGKEEISLLLLWLQQMWEEGREINIDGRELLLILSEYYEEDAEEKADLLSKVCWILGTISIQQNDKEEAYYYSVEGEQALAENRILLHLPQYLERLVFLEEFLDPLEQTEWRIQRDALKELFLSHGKKWGEKDILLWKNFKSQDVYLISEVFEQERKIREKSQEEIAYEIGIDTKTISRLECGTYKQKRETLQKVRKYYGTCRDICNTRIVTDNFRLLEMERKISVLQHLNCEREAEKLYIKLKKKLDTRWKENRQYILYQDMFYNHQFGRISHAEAILQCEQAFQITRPYLNLDRIDQIILGRLECKIINYIGICYRKLGQREKTISLLENAMRGYKNSKVDRKYFFHSLGLIYLNLIDNYEENNQFDDAILLCDEAIRYELYCDKCSDLGYLISEKQYTIDRMNGKPSEEGKKRYQQAFQLMRLMKREVQMKGLQLAYQEWYGERLE